MKWETVNFTERLSPPARFQHTATWVDSRSLLVIIAGDGKSGKKLNDAWAVDYSNPKQPSWVDLKPVEIDTFSQRSQHTCVEYKNNLYVFGGHDGQKGETLKKTKNMFMQLSSETGAVWQWKTVKGYNVKHEPSERYGHCAAVQNRKMYVFGGWLAKQHTWNRDLFRYDFIEKKWELIEVNEARTPKAKGSLTMLPWPDADWYLSGTHDGPAKKKKKSNRILVVDGNFTITTLQTFDGKEKPMWRSLQNPRRPATEAFRENHCSFIVPVLGSKGTQATIGVMGGQGRGRADTLKQDLFQIVAHVENSNAHEQNWSKRTTGGVQPDNRKNHSMTLVQLYEQDQKPPGWVREKGTRAKAGNPVVVLFGGFAARALANDVFTLVLDSDFRWAHQKIGIPKLRNVGLLRAAALNETTLFTTGGFDEQADEEGLYQLRDSICKVNDVSKSWDVLSVVPVKKQKHSQPLYNEQHHEKISHCGHSLTSDRENGAILFGGGDTYKQVLTNDFYRFHAVTEEEALQQDSGMGKKTWPGVWHEIECPKKPEPRAGHTACMLFEEGTRPSLFVVIGGFRQIDEDDVPEDEKKQGNFNMGTYCNDVWVYDYEDTETWVCASEGSQKNDLKAKHMSPRMGHSACGFGNDTIYVFGGSYYGLPYGELFLVSIEFESPGTENPYTVKWKRVVGSGQPPSPRTGHTAVISTNRYNNEFMYVFGGRVSKHTPPKKNKNGEWETAKSNDLFIFDISNSAWSKPTIINAYLTTKSYMSPMVAYDNSILVFSEDTTSMHSKYVELFKLEKLVDSTSARQEEDSKLAASMEFDDLLPNILLSPILRQSQQTGIQQRQLSGSQQNEARTPALAAGDVSVDFDEIDEEGVALESPGESSLEEKEEISGDEVGVGGESNAGELDTKESEMPLEEAGHSSAEDTDTQSSASGGDDGDHTEEGTESSDGDYDY